MSVRASLMLTVVESLDTRSQLAALLQSNWRFDCDKVNVADVPGDLSEWRTLAVKSIDGLLERLQRAIAGGYPFAIELNWENTDVGCLFLFLEQRTVVVNCEVNRVTLPGGRVSDVSWYLARIIPVFNRPGKVTVESWEWRETA